MTGIAYPVFAVIIGKDSYACLCSVNGALIGVLL